MPGNNGNHGKKGRSGRKSAYQEHKDAKALFAAFFDDMSVDEITEKIKARRFSMFDRLKLAGLQGKEKILTKVLDKLVPDLNRVDSRLEGEVSYRIVRGNPPKPKKEDEPKP